MELKPGAKLGTCEIVSPLGRLGTDTGIQPGHTFGSGDHVELARWVQLGLTPMQAITAATSRPAELLGLKDLGTLAVGKSASFIVLDANPLDDILNSRRINSVYLDGAKFDRGFDRGFDREGVRLTGRNDPLGLPAEPSWEVCGILCKRDSHIH